MDAEIALWKFKLDFMLMLEAILKQDNEIYKNI